MAEVHEPYITIYKPVKGWCPILIAWDDSFDDYMPVQPGWWGYGDINEAIKDGKEWAEQEEMPFRFDPEDFLPNYNERFTDNVPGTITVTGAYGNKYSSIISAKKAWDNNIDFRVTEGGPYVNKSDWKSYVNGSTIIFKGFTSNWILQEGENVQI